MKRKTCAPANVNYKNIIGENIRRAREIKGWSCLGLGKEIGMSKAAVSDIENGKSELTVSCLQHIADALDTDVCSLTAAHTIHSKKEFNNMTHQLNTVMDTGFVHMLFKEINN